MIKFLRHIRLRLLTQASTDGVRQRQVTESKFSPPEGRSRAGKYLFYAIGEIILVVVGILIALSINTWNQERQASHKEDVYLDNLETDLENQLASIDIQLSYEKSYADAAEPLLTQHQKDSKFTLDTANCRRLRTLTSRKTFVKTDPTFQDLISTGNIGLIKNKVLRKALLEYYLELERFEKIIQNNNTLHTDELYGHGVLQLVYIGGNRSQKLLDHSNELLKDLSHEMKLINLIESRSGIAEIHIEFMDELRVKTSHMLSELKGKRE